MCRRAGLLLTAAPRMRGLQPGDPPAHHQDGQQGRLLWILRRPASEPGPAPRRGEQLAAGRRPRRQQPPAGDEPVRRPAPVPRHHLPGRLRAGHHGRTENH